ncbi:MAG: ATP-binding protein [Pseudomonadota bacterium]
MSHAIHSVKVSSELDVLVSRQRSRQIAALCAFSNQDQVRISTVVSELARNIFNYAGVGTVEFSVATDEKLQSLVVRFTDDGPGIADLDLILSEQYKSNTGMGLGILGAKRLMDSCEINTAPDGTTIVIKRSIPGGSGRLTLAHISSMSEQLGVLPDGAALAESRQHNQELAAALDTLNAQQEELKAANAAVVSLYAALDLKAAQLQQADVRKDEFLAILAHELRNPLSAIAMAAGSLGHPNVTLDRMGQMGALITRQVGHMGKLVEDLIDVSRVTRGMVEIHRIPLDINVIVRNAIEQLAAAVEAKDQQLKITLPEHVCMVAGDELRLTQVVSNLLSNSVRYTQAGGHIEIALWARDGYVTLTLSDNGIGIAPALLPRLFDLYVQAENSSSGKGGLGIGLTLVKSIVELHGGTVAASSEGPGLGSRFDVRLPQLLS